MKINIKFSGWNLPKYETKNSSGMDLYANIKTEITIGTLERVLIPTGLFLELPIGTEAQIRPRSGLAFKNGITVLNSPGTIDADYRGEIKVNLVNLSNEPFTIIPQTRIAQIVFSKYEEVDFNLVDELNETERGDGGFGSTDNK